MRALIVKTIAGILVCIAAALNGGIFGMYIGGLGICGADFSWFAVSASFVVGGCLSSIFTLLWRKAWWAGALSFSVFLLPIFCFEAIGGELQRSIGISICIVGPFVVAYGLARCWDTSRKKS